MYLEWEEGIVDPEQEESDAIDFWKFKNYPKDGRMRPYKQKMQHQGIIAPKMKTRREREGGQ